MKVTSQTTVREIARQNPLAVRLFEAHGIDYCCGGEQRLLEACRQANISVDTVLAELERHAMAEELPESRWNSAPLGDLVDHIVNKHHAFVRQESPRLTELLQKVRARHVNAHPELNKIGEYFDGLTHELAMHMLKEERVLFPMIKGLAAAPDAGAKVGAAAFSCLEFPIRQMVGEHEDAGEALSGIRSLSSGFQPPDDACPSFRALYQGLADFERDLHQHIHLENNILFPRALDLPRPGQEICSVAG